MLFRSLAVYLMPSNWLAARMAATAPAASAPASAPVVPAAAPLAVPAAPEAASTAENAASAPAGETVFSAPPVSAAASDSGAPAGLVQLRSSEASWVEARDGRGQVLLYRMVLPGESVGLDGALPIRLTIGNAAAMQIGFRGKPVDLGPSTRDNVARVELQ